MSHYISANLGGEELEFSSGLNWRSISALNASGWGIYENYENYSLDKDVYLEGNRDQGWPLSFNRGVSGSGNESKVNNIIATKAYKNALLWAKAFKITYPELYSDQYQHAVNIFKGINVDFEDYMTGMSLNDIETEEELNDLVEYQKLLTEDEVNRAFPNFWRVMEFSYKIYKYTSKGKEVEVYFS